MDGDGRGEQLWRGYITKKNFDLSAWPDKSDSVVRTGHGGPRTDLCIPAFRPPKVSLPVLWARGSGKLDGTLCCRGSILRVMKIDMGFPADLLTAVWIASLAADSKWPYNNH